MTQIILIIHIIIAAALIGVVLLQRSEGGGLGIGGGGGSNFMSGRGTANLLTRTTAVLAACFMATSIVLAILAGGTSQPASILDQLPATGAPAEGEQQGEPAAPGAPAVPVR